MKTTLINTEKEVGQSNMNNLQEKLEIMQWLHSQGLEPDMWYWSEKDNPSTQCTVKLADSQSFDIAWGDYGVTASQPWFTLERVLELLPDHTGIYSYGINKHGLGYLCANSSVLLWESNNNDIHLAALRLLKQVVERFPESVVKK